MTGPVMPAQWEQLALDLGPVVALERIEGTLAELERQADAYEVQGWHGAARACQGAADLTRSQMLAFVDRWA